MDNAAGMCIAQPVAQLLDQLKLPGRGERLAIPDDFCERLALDVLHGNERLSIELADIKYRDDIRMAQARRRTGLTGKSLAQLVVVFDQELDGDLAFEARIPSQEENAHAALPNPFDDLVASDGGRDAGHWSAPLGVLTDSEWSPSLRVCP